MKLKKIASLALAGVMAVSMLAGCSNGTKPDDGEKDPVVDSSLTGKVIAALDEDTTKNVKFTADSNLQAVLNKVVSNVGYTGAANITWQNLNNVDGELGDWNQLPNVGKSETTEDDKDVQKAIFVYSFAGKGMNTATVAKELAKKIDGHNIGKVSNGDVKWADLPEYTPTTSDKDGEFWYALDYAAGVATAEVSDAVTGETEYVVAVTVTRTPTKTYKADK